MNKFAITLSIVLSLLSTAKADDTLGFSGEIKGRKGCTVSVPATIDLGRYSKDQIGTSGTFPGSGMAIGFENCNQDDFGEDVELIDFIGLPGEHDETDPYLWKNLGTAEGVALQIKVQYGGRQEKTISPYGGEYNDIPIENGRSAITVDGVIRKVGTIIPGTIDVIMPFEIRYK